MRVAIRQRYWNVNFKRSITYQGDPCDGLVIHAKREIWFNDTLRGRELSETVIHETGHAYAEGISEPLFDHAPWWASYVVLHPTRGVVGVRECERRLFRVFSFPSFHMTEAYARGLAKDATKLLHHPEILERITDG